MSELTLPDGKVIKVKRPGADDLPYQLKVHYADGRERLIPGTFREPDDVHYGFDYFLSLEVYDMVEDVIKRLKLSVTDQLQIAIAIMNHIDLTETYPCPVVRAEIIDIRDGSVVASTETTQESARPEDEN